MRRRNGETKKERIGNITGVIVENIPILYYFTHLNNPSEGQMVREVYGGYRSLWDEKTPVLITQYRGLGSDYDFNMQRIVIILAQILPALFAICLCLIKIDRKSEVKPCPII